jgi:hypothetical protein
LNESLWFNRFIKKENGQSFGHYLAPQKTIPNGSPFSISDVVKKSPPDYNTKLTYLDEAEMRAKYDANMSKVLLSIIECILFHWRAAIHSKVREPFLPNEWIERKYVLRARPPDFICHIAQCLSGKVSAIKFTNNSKNAMISKTIMKVLLLSLKLTYLKLPLPMLFRDDNLPLLAYQHTLIWTTMHYSIMACMQIKNYCCLAYLG